MERFMTPLYPLVFEPVYKDYIWGGERLKTLFGRANTPTPCAESWEISDRPEGMSVVSRGPLKGVTLAALTHERAPEMFGAGNSPDRFPLLCKIIDAHSRLSVQTHPNEVSAPALGGEPKTEAWYVLQSEPGAFVYAGLHPGVGEAELRQALSDGSVENLLRKLPVKRGDVVFLPGGRVHAIGEGCLLYEVQQNSNTTYRLFDWNRAGTDGKPRELHVEQALKTVLWRDEDDALMPPGCIGKIDFYRASKIYSLLDCPWFRIQFLDVCGVFVENRAQPAAEIVFVETGTVNIESNGVALDLAPGDTALLPACLEGYVAAPLRDRAGLLRIAVALP